MPALTSQTRPSFECCSPSAVHDLREEHCTSGFNIALVKPFVIENTVGDLKLTTHYDTFAEARINFTNATCTRGREHLSKSVTASAIFTARPGRRRIELQDSKQRRNERPIRSRDSGNPRDRPPCSPEFSLRIPRFVSRALALSSSHPLSLSFRVRLAFVCCSFSFSFLVFSGLFMCACMHILIYICVCNIGVCERVCMYVYIYKYRCIYLFV